MKKQTLILLTLLLTGCPATTPTKPDPVEPVPTVQKSRVCMNLDKSVNWHAFATAMSDITKFAQNYEPEGQNLLTFFNTEAQAGIDAGQYRLTWEGSGEVNIHNGAVTQVSFADHERLLNVTGKFQLDINGDVSNVKVVRVGHEGAWLRQDAMERLSEFGTLRFMETLGTNEADHDNWENRTLPSDIAWGPRGMPWEVVFDIANQLKLERVWINFHHTVDADYQRNVFELAKQMLPHSTKLMAEWSNEVWNSNFPVAQLAQTLVASRHGVTGLNRTQSAMMLVAHESKQMCDIGREVMGDQFECVVAGWANSTWYNEYLMRQMETLQVDAKYFAIAPYFGNGVRATDLATLHSDILGLTNESALSLPDAKANIDRTVEEAKTHGLTLLMYEGGQHVFNSNVSVVNSYVNQRNAQFEGVYEDYLNYWLDKTTGPMCLYSFMRGGSASSGYWGHYTGMNQQCDENPKCSAMMKVINERKEKIRWNKI